ncbi:MAG: glycosyltransferase family 87 protein [Bacteroidota bacterium]
MLPKFFYNKIFRIISLSVLGVAAVLLALDRSSRIGIGSDFHVFWQAGYDFFHGLNMYEAIEGARILIYPPFAAFLFQPLAIFPLQASAAIFYLLNVLVLLPLSIWMLREILNLIGFSKERVDITLVLAVLLSFKFFFNNLGIFQVNFLVFTISLAGIYNYFYRREGLAFVFLVIATCIKIYPVFLLLFVFFACLKDRRAILQGVAAGIICMGIPVAVRGIEIYQVYYEFFLEEFAKGVVWVSANNHGLKSAVYKVFLPWGTKVNLFPEQAPLASVVSNLLLLLVLILTIMTAWKAIKSRDPLRLILAFSCIMIFSHMVSGITWTAHLVSLLFILVPLLLQMDRKKRRGEQVVFVGLMAIALILSIEGSDTTGRFFYELVRTYDLFTLFLLSLLVYFTYLAYSEQVYSPMTPQSLPYEST